MPRTIHGTGGTQRELVLDLALDAYTKGHATPLVGSFRPVSLNQISGNHLEATLMNRKTGNRLIICGDTVLGSNHVCGS